MKFKGIEDIRKYYQNHMAKGNTAVFKDFKNYTPVTDTVLISAANDLRECIQRRIDEYYLSYEPKVYNRTYGLKNALRAETAVRTENGRKVIGLYFQDHKSWGRSVFTGELNGYKPWLINDGWKVKKTIYIGDRKIQRNPNGGIPYIHRFGYYEGYDFIGKGIADWRKKPRHKKIEVRRTQAGMFDIAKTIGYYL